jgi:hypothetical protein
MSERFIVCQPSIVPMDEDLMEFIFCIRKGLDFKYFNQLCGILANDKCFANNIEVG